MDNDVTIEISADDNATDKIENVAKATEKLGDGMQKNFNKAADASKNFAKVLAVAGVGVVGGLTAAVFAAADAQVKIAQFDATLKSIGNVSEDTRKKLLTASEAVTRLGFDDETAAISMAKLYQRTGDVNEAIKLNALAMDLARDKHLGLEQASNLVGQVLAGNGRVLKQYGIDIKETASPMEALAELQNRVSGQADAFSQTFKGQMEVFKETFGNFLEEVGTPLLGFVTKIIAGFLSWVDAMGGVKGICEQLTATFAIFQPYLPLIAGAVAGALVPAFLAWGMTLFTVTIPAIIASLVALGPYIIVGAAVAAVAVLIYKAWTENWGGIRDFLLPLLKLLADTFVLFWTNLKAWFTDGGEFVSMAWQNMMNGIKNIAIGVWETVKSTFTDGINWIVDKINSAVGAINGAVSKATFGKVKTAVPSVPRLAAGGIVTQPTLAVVGEAGPEAVIPLSRGNAGMGSVTIVVEGNNFYGDDETFAQKIGDQIMRMLEPHISFNTV